MPIDMRSVYTLIKQHFALVIFLVVYFIFIFSTYKAFPIGNGEEFRYLRGKETLEHFLSGDFKEKLIQPTPNYFLYNLYTSGLVFLNPRFLYEWFHLMNLIFAALGFIGVYCLSLMLSKSKLAAMFCLVALVLFPGFFGQLAFNPVDMPFMVFYILLLLSLLKFSKNDTNHWSTLLLGLLFGVTQALRQLGFTLYLLMLILDFYDYFMVEPINRPNIKEFAKNRTLKYLFIFILANFFMVITWPNFAVNFFKSYYWYLFVGANFYLWDFGLLFFGKFLTNPERPWYYLPFLQLITYPIYITAFFLPIVTYFKANLKNRAYFIITVTIILNYLMYLVLNPVLYDGIRHFLFLTPLIVLISVANIFSVFNAITKNWLKLVITVAITLNLASLAIHTVSEFPYHYVYFNKLAQVFGDPYKHFESDYSNTKYREASEWIRDVYLKDEAAYSHSDPKKMLKIYPCDNAYAVDYFSHKKFLTIIDKNKAELTLCDYRNLKQSGYTGEVVKTFSLDGNQLLYLLHLNLIDK